MARAIIMWQHWYAQPTSAPAGQSPSPTPTHHVLSDEPLTSILPTRTSQRWQRDESYQLVIVSVTTILVGLETRCRTCSSAFARPRADQPEQMASPEHRQGDHSCVHHRAEIRPAHLRAAAQRYSRDKYFLLNQFLFERDIENGDDLRMRTSQAVSELFARGPWLEPRILKLVPITDSTYADVSEQKTVTGRSSWRWCV